MGESSAGWLHLLGDLSGRTVLIEPGLTAEAGEHVRELGAELVGADSPADIAVYRGRTLNPDVARWLVGSVGAAGRIAVVATNPVSPLTVLDRLCGETCTGVVARPSTIAATLRSAGAHVVQNHGLLRSAQHPVTAADLAAPHATRAVLEASRTHVHGWRGQALRVLGRMIETRLLVDSFPAVLVTAVRVGPSLHEGPRVTGLIGNRDSEEFKIVIGEPPEALEKHYSDNRSADAEERALQILERSGVGIAPRFLGRPGPLRLRMEWVHGGPVGLPRDAAAARRLVERAVDVLVLVQRHSVQADGSVLVHGDFWLGNLVDDGERLTVVDWTDSYLGSPDTDRDFFIAELGRADPRRGPELADVARARLAQQEISR